MKIRRLACVSLFLAGWFSVSAQVFTGSNAPNTGTTFSVPVGTGTTNLSITVGGTASAYSYVLVRKGTAPTETAYDFSSQVNGQTNAIYLEEPEVSAGTYYVRVSTPAASPSHAFTLIVEGNRADLRTAVRPVSKPLSGIATGISTNNSYQYFRVELTTYTFWRVRLDGTTQSAPDVYAARGQLPTESSFLKRSLNVINDSLVFTSSEAAPGVYFVGIFGAGAPSSGVPYTMHIEAVIPETLIWDPGLTHLGTEVHTNLSGVAGDYYFRMNTANPSLGAWRTALRLLDTNSDANLYLSRGTLPTPEVADYKSERVGSDGVVLGLGTQFQPSEDWYILVRARAGAQWTLLSGAPFVTDLGTVAADGSSGSGDVEIGPEGLRFFSATAPANMLAWRLWLNGRTNSILVKKTSLPLPMANAYELSQPAQALVVPPYLSGGQYFIGVSGLPGVVINLDSRQQEIIDLAFGGSAGANVPGFGYVTYRVQVPPQQVAWQMYVRSTNGNPNLAVRRNTVPNESNNDAFSEVPSTVVDNITLVPPVLSDGTFYLTVYGTNGFNFTLENSPAVVTDINYVTSILNDDPTRVGWRYYRVLEGQLGSLGWDLFLTNFAPGTRIAIRNSAAPSFWSFRNPGLAQANYYDVLSTADFLQHPAHQASLVWYIGVYNPSNALGPFTLVTQELPAAPLADNVPAVRTNVLSGRWEFFRVQITPQEVQGSVGPGPIMGWDLRLVNVTSGLPRLVVRREAFPTSLQNTFSPAGSSWPNGGQWGAGSDWTKRMYSPDGATNEDGRILAMGIGRPLEPGTYYIGVINSAGSNNMSYTLLSRWIGPGRAIPVQDLSWDSGRVTNTVAPREAAYYRVVIPPNSPSWKVRLSPLSGEAMLVAVTNRLPTVESEKRMQKADKEQYVMLPAPSADIISAGTNFLTVVGEGISPADNTRIGSGPSSFVLESLGAMPDMDLGVLTTNDFVINATLEGGESAAYHFYLAPTSLGMWAILENDIGNPWVVGRFGLDLADPGTSGDTYGNEGGESAGAASSPYMVVGAASDTYVRIMTKARAVAGTYQDASYTLRIKEIVPEPVAFDGGTYQIVDRPVEFESFFVIDVPPNALGWDLRLTNVISGSPQLLVSRGALPIFNYSAGLTPSPATATNWPIGARWVAGADWTERTLSPEGASESGRILAMGMGRPLEPGRYYVGVLGSGLGPVNCTLVSRGIGPGFAIPVTDLDFAGGQTTIASLPAREAAYFRVTIPSNAASWKVELAGTSGESLLIALQNALPNVGALYNTSATNSGGRKMQKLGDEEFLLLPGPGRSRLTPGAYYLAVVSEGQLPNASRIGTGTSDFTIRSLGETPTNYLGEVGAIDLVDANSLAGGEVRIYQFSVPAGIQTVEARLENRTGNPTMTLRAGSRAPDPGASAGTIPQDPYGNDGGESPGNDVSATLISVPNPTNGLYTLAVKARSAPYVLGVISNATYTLRVMASSTLPVEFDLGTATVANQVPLTWRYFRVVVPTNALGWDVRLVNVLSGLPRLVVRRESLPNSLTTTPWGTPGTAGAWPTNAQWAPTADWTRRGMSVDGTISEDGRILAMGLYRPLEPGTYYVGVINSLASTNMSYTFLSRGIGPGFAIPLVDLPFVGSATNMSLPAREAAYYRVVVPSNSPNWKLKLTGLVGESMLAALRNALPNFDTIGNAGSLANGKSMQKLGNEHFVLLPGPGQTNVQAGTNYLAVISEGVNPGTAGRIGPGNSAYVLNSQGTVPVLDLGLLTSEDLVQPDTLEGGEVKAYRFTVPMGTYGVKVRLENRVNNPMVVVLPGDRLPDPGATVSGQPSDSYGNEGGYPPTDGHAAIVTLANPNVGTYSLMVKARPLGTSNPDASYTLRVQEILAPELNFSEEQNVNGLSNEASGLLEDNERAFFKFIIPATINGQPVIGWKLDLVQSSGMALMRARRDLLPSDAAAASQMAFTNASAIIAPPYLTNGVWFVEVRAVGSTAFTLKSSPLMLQRPAWVMPAPGEPSQTPGVTLPVFGDTAIGTNGLAGDQSIFLEQGFLHYYAVQVPSTNVGLLRAQLDAVSGNPDMYVRAGAVPTLYHNVAGAAGTLYDRAMVAPNANEYANWVPIDSRLEKQLKPGLWYLAVRAGGNANARYRLRLSIGNIVDLPIHGTGLTNQIVAGGDWLFYRVAMPTALPLGFNITFSQQSGDAWMYLRDTVPPGTGITGSQYDLRDWSTDSKNFGPYPNYPDPGTFSFVAPPVRPGQVFYLGFRALSDSTFSVCVTTNGVPAQEPTVVPFYGGTAFVNVPAYSSALFRVDVPPEATRWRHFSTHPTNLVVCLDQGTIPTRAANRWMSYAANSSYNAFLVTWNDTLKQYGPATWPWVPGQSYFLMVTNVTTTPQDFSLVMDGRNAATDDNDTDTLPDAWELLYFGHYGQTAGNDPDRDGVSNLDEYYEGTNPNDAGSYLARLSIVAINGIIQRQPDLPSYPLGSTVVLTPVPANGYAFIGWSGQAGGIANPLSLTMDSHKTITATFKRAGDDFITALPITGASATVYGTNVSFTKEPGEPNHAGNPGGKSIWWRWTAPASGPVSISTAGSAFTTLLAVYTGPTVSNLTCLASDINSTGGTNRSFVTFNATAGETYNIAVDGYNGASSRITLTLSPSAVVVRPRLTDLARLPDGTAACTLVGEANRAYVIEYSEDLISWNDLSSVTTSGSGTAAVSDSSATTAAKRFYRARVP